MGGQGVSSSLTAGRSQPASMRISAAAGLEASQVIQVAAASFVLAVGIDHQAVGEEVRAFCS